MLLYNGKHYPHKLLNKYTYFTNMIIDITPTPQASISNHVYIFCNCP